MKINSYYIVTPEDNIALIHYLANNFESSNFKRQHFSIFADSNDQFGETGSKRRITLRKTLSNWTIRGRIPDHICQNFTSANDKNLLQLALLSLQKLALLSLRKRESNVDNLSPKTEITTTTTTTTPIKSTPTTMNFFSPKADSMLSNPDDATFHCGTLRADVEYKMNLQGLVANITRACPEFISGNPVGSMDKLLLCFPMWDIRDKGKYKAWLHPEARGVFVEHPATAGWFFKERKVFFNTNKGYPADPATFDCRCSRTFDSFENMFQDKTQVDNKMVSYWDFPEDMTCSNAHFNKDSSGTGQASPLKLLRKDKSLKYYVIQPNPTGATDSLKNGTYAIVSTIYFELEIVNRFNIVGGGLVKADDDLSEFADLSIG